ncbi:aldehyde dehydrogenase (NADP(+)) [Mycolicibacterium flavescens]|uniref:2,5-dioxovalerate dehydrogenase n=1 Tax=Mycolicibacterium flavescens TaxID=1776 RepID=A0A1E3RCJ2_MYCFV|nr:aldehyde dehydrogenase (NADP(+)) [Mycolicibacterium flavescens]MCV7278300.1 aldehyde dehydrogenase (NADP(+)) [Mycolicibacterium flavescens]ODQ87142.1 2,5-dioxovalerate dehydrogenase [Mycolicibacterium flavescens]
MTATLPETTGITGQMIIAGAHVRGSGQPVRAFNPATGETLEPAYHYGDSSHVDAACSAAAEAFAAYRATTAEQRAQFLEAIAANIEAVKDAIIARATAESGLPTARITGEVGRTTGQLRLFAGVLREGSWNHAVIDPAQPDRQPAPRPDIRQRSIALGPVAVFGASNFPLAFSVAGGDTASALAAGCPVVVKGHDAHPGTSELVGRAVTDAVAAAGLPAGTFSLLFGDGPDLGTTLVTDPRIKAVGFTGSRSGGTALVAAAAARPEPIPVYAEMSSINPVFLLDGALATRGAQLGEAFVASLTMGSGQFCTNPGLVIAVDGPGLDGFVAAARDALTGSPATPMLTPGIARSYATGVDALTQHAELVGRGQPGDSECACHAALFTTDAATFLKSEALQAEVFGSSSLIVRCKDAAEMRTVASTIEGQLTATVHADESDYASAGELLPLLELKAGRILFDGWPTGVEVGHAMVHGGPYPATSDSRTTSVGARAIERFLRPVSYQNVPKALLPSAIADGNPDKIWRRVDGQLTHD